MTQPDDKLYQQLVRAGMETATPSEDLRRRVLADATAATQEANQRRDAAPHDSIQSVARLVPDVPTDLADGVQRGPHLIAEPPSRRRTPRRFITMFHRRSVQWASAAVVALAVLGGFSLFSRSPRPGDKNNQWWLGPPSAWASEIQAALQTVKALTFREQIAVVGSAGSTHVSGSWRQHYEASDRSRVDQYYEQTLVSTGWDVPEGKDLLHYGVSYEYECYTLRREQGAAYNRDPVNRLRFYEQYRDRADRVLGTKVFDGRNCVGFDLIASKYGTNPEQRVDRIWVDAETRLPARLEIHGLSVTDHPEETTTLIQDRFEYYTEVPAEMFKPVIPPGFVNTHPDNVRKTREAQDKGTMESAAVPPEWKQQAIAAMKAAKTVVYRSNGRKVSLSEFAWRVDAPYEGGQPTQTEWYVIEKNDPARTSLEVTDEGFRLVQTIVNYTQRSYKQIVFGAKDHPRHPLEELLHPFGHLDKADRILEPQDIEGVRCVGVEISAKKYGTNPDGMLHRLWLDETTKLPVRMEFEIPGEAGRVHKSVKDRFEWNPPLPEDTFVPVIPDGFVESGE